jgi:hypothetical protein
MICWLLFGAVGVPTIAEDVTLTLLHTIGIDICKERQPVIAGHKLWQLSVCRVCQTGSQHQIASEVPYRTAWLSPEMSSPGLVAGGHVARPG